MTGKKYTFLKWILLIQNSENINILEKVFRNNMKYSEKVRKN